METTDGAQRRAKKKSSTGTTSFISSWNKVFLSTTILNSNSPNHGGTWLKSGTISSSLPTAMTWRVSWDCPSTVWFATKDASLVWSRISSIICFLVTTTGTVKSKRTLDPLSQTDRLLAEMSSRPKNFKAQPHRVRELSASTINAELLGSTLWILLKSKHNPPSNKDLKGQIFSALFLLSKGMSDFLLNNI